MKCPCCTHPGIDEGHVSEPYLCTQCAYITDDVGTHYCEGCEIYMEAEAAWYHSYREGEHEVVDL